jgi:hypothetical protein
MKYKNTLWTFGDSFTYGYGCLSDDNILEYYNKYRKKDSDIWPVLLSRKLNLNLNNISRRSMVNDDLFDLILENYNNIKEGDYVIVGKTLYQRYIIPNVDDKPWYVGPIYLDEDGKMPKIKNINIITKDKEQLKLVCKDDQEYELLINYINRYADSIVYKQRQDFRFNFIKKELINNKKISFYYEWEVADCFTKGKKLYEFEKIKDQDTNILDAHFSFNGHKQMFNYLLDKINRSNNKII